MIELKVPAMSCGHCVRAITEAVQAADPAADVQVDLASKQVTVQTNAARELIVQRLAEAGYPPD